MGLTRFAERTISLRRGMTYAERRSTVLHECLHVERGAVPMGLAAKEEERVARETARLLLPDVRAVGEALAWALTLEEAADDLAVDLDVLRTRLEHLHPAERGYLRHRLEAEA